MTRRAPPPEAWLLAGYLALWAVLAVDPRDRVVWLFENLLVFLGLPVLVLTHRAFTFSLRSYVAMTAFLALHAVGSHYGYANVPLPWESWAFARNHSDRVVHFAFGLLAVLPVEEILRRLARIGAGWREGLTVVTTFAFAAAFEVVEWAAVVVGGDAVGPRTSGYLGTQGDEFDAVKDMALGLAGAAATTLALLAATRARDHFRGRTPRRR